MTHSVLFICSANICRSPMAMSLLRGMVQPEASVWKIDSAGVWAEPGYPAAVLTRAVLKSRGLEVNEHRSQPVTLELIDQYSLVLTMEQGQKEALRLAFPQVANRVFLLAEMIGEAGNIADPISGPLVDYELTAKEIEQILERGMDRIRQLSKDPAQ